MSDSIWSDGGRIQMPQYEKLTRIKKVDVTIVGGVVCIPSSRQLKKYKIFVLPGVYRATFLCRQSLLFMKFHWC